MSWRVLVSLERRIGGVRAGSAGLVFALDSVGLQLVREQPEHARRSRQTEQPSGVLLGHRLGVAEVFASLTELSRTEGFSLVTFTTEPACWWPDGMGGQLKPDAFLLLGAEGYADAWWLEQDQGSEHLPVIHRKLTTYLEFANSGQPGPTDVVPRVMISVPDETRRHAIAHLIHRLPEPSVKLLHVSTHAEAPRYLLSVLKE